MSTVVSIQNGDRTSALYRRLDRRLLSFLLICYLFACLDRLNVGFARLHMQSDIGLTDAQYGLAAGIFFIGYALFEVPSNLLLPKTGARKAISRILVLWGLTSAAMVATRDATTFYVLRFLLGVFEAGFTPGILFYLTCWYPESRRAKAIAAVMIGGPLAGVLGGPLSMWIMTTFAGLGGLSGWQWMYLIEGCRASRSASWPACCLPIAPRRHRGCHPRNGRNSSTWPRSLNMRSGTVSRKS